MQAARRSRHVLQPVLLWATLSLPAACRSANGPGGGGGGGGGTQFLSGRYPCDAGIASDPAVVWAENFEEGSVSAVTSRYNDYKNPSGMALVADRPAGSCGTSAMRFTAGGANPATDLYKHLPTGQDELYVRWYAKYEAGAHWHHSGVWFGGYNPPSDWPNPQAGTRPTGSDRISVALEPVWGIGAPNPMLDFYNYWVQMHTCSSCGGSYWGNALISRSAFVAPDNTWACLEVHAKLNGDPASDAGAELEVWRNDSLIQHFPETGGAGYWVQDHFCPAGADGPQCAYSTSAPGPLDLQFRTTTALQLNYFWPQNYITDSTLGSVSFDDMVVATVRIGCRR